MPLTLSRTAVPWLIGVLAVALAVLTGAAAITVSGASVDAASARAELRQLVDDARAEAAVTPLTHNAELDAIAQERADALAEAGALAHDAVVMQRLPSGWWAYAENIADGRGASAAAMNEMWLASPKHAANVQGAGYTDGGFGFAVAADGTTYGVELFAAYVRPPAAATSADSAPGVAIAAAQMRAATPTTSPVREDSTLMLFGAAGVIALAAVSAVLFVLFARGRAPRRRVRD